MVIHFIHVIHVSKTICIIISRRSLERRLQRPLLAKSRTLPSIPQSPIVGRVHQNSQLAGGSEPCSQLASSPTHLSACTLPPAGTAWSLHILFLFHIKLMVSSTFGTSMRWGSPLWLPSTVITPVIITVRLALMYSLLEASACATVNGFLGVVPLLIYW